jgi:hypothetical protein
MASLTLDVAAARREAAQLRSDAVALRVTAQHIAWESNRSRAACVVARERARPLDGLRFRSAWSDLHWRPPTEELDRVLVAVDRSDSDA